MLENLCAAGFAAAVAVGVAADLAAQDPRLAVGEVKESEIGPRDPEVQTELSRFVETRQIAGAVDPRETGCAADVDSGKQPAPIFVGVERRGGCGERNECVARGRRQVVEHTLSEH